MGLTDPQQAPLVLYRYLRWKEPQKDLLTESKVYFAAPRDFNDPFDCQMPLYIDPNTSAAQMRKLLSDPERQPDWLVGASRKQRDAWVTKRTLELHTQRGRQTLSSESLRRVNEQFGILSLTERKDSLLMWAHYGASHQGLCVGLDTAVLEESTRAAFLRRRAGSELRKVKYTEKYPRVNPFDDNYMFGAYVDVVTSTKSAEWAYEKEWRMIVAMSSNEHRFCTLKKGIVREVILGLRMPPEYEAEVRQAIRNQHKEARLFRAKVCEDRFALEFEEITIDR